MAANSHRLRRLLDLVTETVEWPIHAVDLPENWSSESGKLVLLGDAAHAMVPYMALGAAMAVEDAAALAAALKHLTTRDELAKVISKWAAVRKPRVTQIHQASYSHGLILHLADGPVQEARDEALRGELTETPIEESPNQWSDPTLTEWVYSYRPEVDINESWNLPQLQAKPS
jgi:salicylate hydroxylase